MCMVEKSLKSGFHLFRFHQSQPDFLSFEVQFSSRASAYSFIFSNYSNYEGAFGGASGGCSLRSQILHVLAPVSLNLLMVFNVEKSRKSRTFGILIFCNFFIFRNFRFSVIFVSLNFRFFVILDFS